MDVLMIFNGLGNQMSQYAFYLKKRQRSGSARFIFLKKSANVHNGYELDRVFGIIKKDTVADHFYYFIYLAITSSKLTAILQPIVRLTGLLGMAVIDENDDYTFQPKLLQPSRGIKYYVGGWHSEKYFIDVKDKVLHEFQFDFNKIGPANLEVLDKIRACTSVSVHVRRGDFMDSHNFHKLGAVCTLNYFVTAIEKMKTLAGDPHFFFFTNDHAWVREHFTGDRFTVVDLNSGADSWKDMFLMSNCTHNIASNGSFSWWAAYLNRNPDKTVIVPNHFVVGKYFEDIYPASWIRLSDY
jgi:hypothetical protein